MQATVATQRPRPFGEIPRPTAHPLLGHLHEWLGVRQARAVLPLLLRYAEECGPLCRVPLGPTTILLVSDPRLAGDVLVDDAANHKGLTYGLTRVVMNNVLLHNGEVWSHHRRLYREALRGVDVFAAGNQAAAALHARWRGLGPAAPVGLDREAGQLVGDAAAALVCSAALPPHLDADRRRIQYELAAVGIDLQCQPWAYLSPSRWWRLSGAVRRTRAHFLDVVRQRRRLRGEEPPDALSGLLRLARQGDYPDSDEALREGLVNLFFTAHDVVASALAWCLHLLAAHPAVQERLAAELAGLPPGPLERERVESAPYLGQVVKESLRLYPGYPLFGRTTRAETTLGGYAVPRGVFVIVCPYVTHRLSTHWPNSAAFDPERFAGAGAPPPAVRGAYLPFGSGHRACIASQLAFPLMKLLVAQVVRHARLDAEPGHVPALAYCGTAYSETGLPARLTLR